MRGCQCFPRNNLNVKQFERRIMGKQVELCDLTEEEYEKIVDVLKRDHDLRSTEKKRIHNMENGIHDFKTRTKLLTSNPNFNDSCCLNCCTTFMPFIVPKVICEFCSLKYCKRCLPSDRRKSNGGFLICIACAKERDCQSQKNSWFYDEVKRKFGAHGSSKMVRSLKKRKSMTNSDPDSGYLSKRSKDLHHGSSVPSSTDEDISVNLVYSGYRELLDASFEKIRQALVRNQQSFGQTGNSKTCEESLKTQKRTIGFLLSSVVQDVRDGGGDDDAESHRKPDWYIIHEFLSYAMPIEKDEIHRFNIDPETSNIDEYIEHVSEAIVEKAVEDFNAVAERKMAEELPGWSDKVTLSTIAAMMTFGSGMHVTGEEDINDEGDGKFSKRTGRLQLGDEEDVDEVDLESLRSFTESKSKEVPLPPPDLPMEFMKKLYGIDDNGKTVDGRPLTFVDPDLDVISMTSSSSVVNDFGADANSEGNSMKVIMDNPWQLGGRGSFIMKKKIPYGVNDGYGTDRKDEDSNDDGAEEDDKDGDEGKKLTDEDENKELVIFLPEENNNEVITQEMKKAYVVPFKKVLPSKQESVDDPDVLEDTNLSMFRRKQSMDNEKLSSIACTDEGNGSSEAPWFVEHPTDTVATLGEPLQLKCVTDGQRPIDVTWYKHSRDLLELNDNNERVTRWQQGGRHWIELNPLTRDDQGYYMCIASNKAGFCQRGFRISVVNRANDAPRSRGSNQKQDDVSSSQHQRERVDSSSKRNLQTTRTSTEMDQKTSSSSSENQPSVSPAESEMKMYEKKESHSNELLQSEIENISSPVKQKKSSLSYRWLLGGVEEESVFKKPESYSIDDVGKVSGQLTTKARPTNKAEALDHAIITDEIRDSQNLEVKHGRRLVNEHEKVERQSSIPQVSECDVPKITLRSTGKAEFQVGSRSGNADDEKKVSRDFQSLSLSSSSNFIPNPMTLIPEHMKKEFVVKKASNESPHPVFSSSSQRQSRCSDDLESTKHKHYHMRPISKSSFGATSQQTSGDDVFSEAGENSSDDLKLPSVQELRKKFSSEDNLKQHVQQPRQQTFQHRSNVPLVPIPVNRELQTPMLQQQRQQFTQQNQRQPFRTVLDVRVSPEPPQGGRHPTGSVRVLPEHFLTRESRVHSKSYGIPSPRSDEGNVRSNYTSVINISEDGTSTQSQTSLQMESNPKLYKNKMTTEVPSFYYTPSDPQINLSSRSRSPAARSPMRDPRVGRMGSQADALGNSAHKRAFVSIVDIASDCDIIASYENLSLSNPR